MKTTSMRICASVLLMAGLFVGCASQKGTMSSDDKGMTMTTASSGDVAAVEAVVYGLFDGMRERDADKVASFFAEEALLQTTGTQNGKPMTSKQPASNFATAVRNASGPTWDEKIWDLKIEVNGRLASAWMDYAFYLGENFSHCGANSFQLFNGEEGWEIIYLVDSRQREGCEIPEFAKPGVNG